MFGKSNFFIRQTCVERDKTRRIADLVRTQEGCWSQKDSKGGTKWSVWVPRLEVGWILDLIAYKLSTMLNVII